MRKKFKKDLRDVLSYTKQEDLLLTNYEIRKIRATKVIRRNVTIWWRRKTRKAKEAKAALII